MNPIHFIKQALLTAAVSASLGLAPQSIAQSPPAVGMANPASVNCIQKGGKLQMVNTPAGQAGYCTLPNGVRCEEWALFRGECPAAQPKPRMPTVGYTDPFAYCKVVKNIDVLDKRYIGKPLPKPILKALDLSAEGEKMALESPGFVTWRCMNQQVWACTVGANIPCEAKADISRTPHAGIVEYCKAERNSDFIPAVAAGRTTIYEWSCKNGKPKIGKPHTKVDARGYPANFWTLVKPK